MAQTVKTPKVTVLMPVYNGAKYLHKAIESILKQTFTDFELLIINDGSTDNSLSIMELFHDSRIQIIHNKKNIGLVNTLNMGIELAKGEYIARMDNDDISYADRLSKEVDFLDANPDYAVVAANVVLINADGEKTGSWEEDMITTTFDKIKFTLSRTNCIAHPTVMIRKSVAAKYKFRNNQKGAEDWDLWMRLVADGIKIGKINETLLQYRVHPLSVSLLNQTGQSNQKKVIRIKRNFILSQLIHFKVNGFFFEVLYSYLRSNVRWIKIYFLPDAGQFLKRLLTINPVKVLIDFAKLKKYLSVNKHSLIFFFPYTHVGGAERVHANIVECLKNENPLVFFTGFSNNRSFLKSFEKNAKIFNIPEVLNYPLTKQKAKKVIADYINSQANAKILGCHSIFYYDLLSFLMPKVYCIDLKHSFIYPDNGAEKALLPKIMRLDKRIFISKTALENTIKFYHENNIPKLFSERLCYIPNGTKISQEYKKNKPTEKINVIYVGRATAEKRVNLVVQIATNCQNRNMPVSFKMIGDLKGVINETKYPHINFAGEITDENKLENIYTTADILLITSSTEGFPMTVIEAMANGVVPISTRVGDIALHIKNRENGFITSSNEATDVVEQITEYIKILSDDRKLLGEISWNAYQYAKENFSEEKFKNAYRALFGF